MRLTIRSTLVDCCTGRSADVVIDNLNRALQDLLADPDLKKPALDLGIIDAKAATPAEMEARMRSDIDK